MFDFDCPENRDTDETISLLFRMARFVVVDLTDARCTPQELRNIEQLMSVPVQPLLQDSAMVYGMWDHYSRYPTVLPIYKYTSLQDVVASVEDKIIAPVEAKVRELRGS
jgi:hypothetical protein